MENLDLYRYRQQIRKNNIILSFEGAMSQGVLTALIDALKQKVTANNVDISNSMQFTIRKICAILVELAQNIQNHSLEQALQSKVSSGLGIIVIRENLKYFSLTSGNNLLTDEAQKLAEYCAYLNGLDDANLKKLYKEKLKRVRAEDEKGGGLGLIEIIRTSGQPIEYTMQTIDNETLFFSLSIKITKAANEKYK